jgi:hypothetical protein
MELEARGLTSGHHRTLTKLLIIRPAPSTTGTRQDLNPPKPRLRAVLNYVHSDRPMPQQASNWAWLDRQGKEGPEAPLTNERFLRIRKFRCLHHCPLLPARERSHGKL